MPIFDKVNGVYRKVSKPYSNVNGAWRQDKKIYDRVNGVWRETYTGAQCAGFYGHDNGEIGNASSMLNSDGSFYLDGYLNKSDSNKEIYRCSAYVQFKLPAPIYFQSTSFEINSTIKVIGNKRYSSFLTIEQVFESGDKRQIGETYSLVNTDEYSRKIKMPFSSFEKGDTYRLILTVTAKGLSKDWSDDYGVTLSCASGNFKIGDTIINSIDPITKI